MQFDYASRLARVQTAMSINDISWMFLSIGADLPYLTGYAAPYTERLTLLTIPVDGPATLLVPKLEEPRVPDGPFEVIAWTESEHPVQMLKSLLRPGGRVAIGDQTWASVLVELETSLDIAEWFPASELTASLRMVKESEEVAALQRVASQADHVAERIPNEIRFVGSTELEVSLKVRQMLVEEGHDVGEFAIVGSGPNGSSPHHEPGDRIISTGELVVIDFGGSLGGYKSDTTRTFSVGPPTRHQQEVHEVVLSANKAGRSRVAPGVPCEDVDTAARQVIDDAGYGEYFIHRTGHGIGLEVHEHPYLVAGNSQPLESGMVFSVEPGVYLPGEFGVRIEDIVACGDEAVINLNDSPRDLTEVE